MKSPQLSPVLRYLIIELIENPLQLFPYEKDQCDKGQKKIKYIQYKYLM